MRSASLAIKIAFCIVVMAASAAQAAGQQLAWPTNNKNAKAVTDKRNGKDALISAPAGSPVIAIADGIVAYAGNGVVNYPNLILINHADGTNVGYIQNQEMRVREGQKVRRGQQIGTVGDGGQLWLTVRSGSQPVDALTYLRSATQPSTSADTKKSTGGASGYYLGRLGLNGVSHKQIVLFSLLAANSLDDAKRRMLDQQQRYWSGASVVLSEADKCPVGWAIALKINSREDGGYATCGISSLQDAVRKVFDICKRLSGPSSCGSSPGNTGDLMTLTFVQLPAGKAPFQTVWGYDETSPPHNFATGSCLLQRDGMNQYFFVQAGNEEKLLCRAGYKNRYVVDEMIANGVVVRD